eukprot:TRINITY_DN320_c0_g2_i1.p1 TRINITY_DN320_c0_g2~~TRINITY_DN320_c0_g2_i1.p1  ORF type:complete len:338 (+),score=65.03 TRINITY_DN320_c0_g2_i1:76-1014(+)
MSAEWEASTDAATGRTYWYNKKTLETSWTDPTGGGGAAPAAQQQQQDGQGGSADGGDGWTGIVSAWNDEKGFGFITPRNGEKDVFCHRMSFGGTGHLSVGLQVHFSPPSVDERRPDRIITKRVWGPAVQNSGNRGGLESAGYRPMTYSPMSPPGCAPGQLTGTVAGWREEKGFGFITPRDGSKDVFCHRMAFGGQGYLIPGEVIYYDPPAPDPRRPDRSITPRVQGPAVVTEGKGKGGWGAAWGGRMPLLGAPGAGAPYNPAFGPARSRAAIGPWTKHHDAATGTDYWYNYETGQSSWADPSPGPSGLPLPE